MAKYFTRIDFVKEVFVIVHPDFDCSHGVMVEYFYDTSWPGVR